VGGTIDKTLLVGRASGDVLMLVPIGFLDQEPRNPLPVERWWTVEF
jgi:hypothetical protein